MDVIVGVINECDLELVVSKKVNLVFVCFV